MTELIEVAVGDSELTLAPEIGGGIAGWTHAGTPVLRPVLPGALESRNPRGLGCYPLVPFSGRVAGNRFTWRGVSYELPALLGGDAIHGAGWQEPWRVADLDATSVSVVLDHIPNRLWPFSFRAEQYFVLAADGLTCEMEITNTHTHPAPAAFGLHPYFPRSPAGTLQFAAAGVWFNRAGEGIPSHRAAVPPEWDHATARPPVEGIDNCFADWSRPARIAWPDRGLSLTIDADPVFRHLVVHVPPGRDIFAVEPTSNLTDGLNRIDNTSEHGFAILDVGATARGAIRFTLATP